MTSEDLEHDLCPVCGTIIGLQNRTDDPGSRQTCSICMKDFCAEHYGAGQHECSPHPFFADPSRFTDGE